MDIGRAIRNLNTYTNMSTYRKYDEEFRRNAVDLYLSSGKPLATVARELGVTPNSLRSWKKRMLGQNGGGVPVAVGDGDTSAMSAEQLAEDNRRLRRENEYLIRKQREILKKAALILGEDPR